MSEVKETPKIGKGKAGPGRSKGVPNRTTQSAKDAIAFAADGLGGGQRLVDWVKEDEANEKAFWTTIYPKLLPLQVANQDGETFKTSVTMIELVAMKKNDEA